jgi:hypothetical protein
MGVDASKVNLYALRNSNGLISPKANAYILFLPAQPLAFSSKLNAYAANNPTGEGNSGSSKINFYVLWGPPIIPSETVFIGQYLPAFKVPIPVPDMSTFSF